MSLKIITGKSASGKTTYMLGCMPSDGSSIYIVPEQFSFSAEKKLIEKFGVVGLGNPVVLSFMRLADMVFANYESPSFISDDASFEMLVSYCANSINPEKLRLFDGLVKKSELAHTASDVITTFKRYCISPNMLESAIERTRDEFLKKKLSDSLIVYNEYLKALSEAGISDKNDMLSILANILSDEKCDFLTDKHIFIDQFYDFDPSEFECIKIMLKRAKSVTVALCMDDGEEFETVRRTYNKLISICSSISVAVEDTVKLTASMIGASPMLRHLESNYFDDEGVSLNGTDGSISIFCAKDKNSEIHNVARNIVHLVRNEGLRYKDISVIARDAEQYKSITDRIFPFYDIPAFIDRKLPLSGHSISVFVTSVLDIAVGGFTYDNVFQYIKSPFSPLTLNEADELENYCLSAGVRAYAWGKPFLKPTSAYTSDSSRSSNNYDMDKINELRLKVYNPLAKLVKKLKRKSTVREVCKYLFDFFDELQLEKRTKHIAYELEENGENLHALQTVQVYNILVDIFMDICAVLGEKELTLHEFRTTVLAGLQSVEIGTIPSSHDSVTVGSIDRIKGHGAKVVFLVGVNSGVFPFAATRNGLFSDEDKKEMERLGIEMPPTLSHLAQSESLLIYDALTCATDKLYISYASADSSSNAMIPSEIVERIRVLFPDASFSDDIMGIADDETAITSKKAVFDIVVDSLRSYMIEGKPLSPSVSAAAYYFNNDQEYAPLLSHSLMMTSFSNRTSIIRKDLIDKAIDHNMKTSITRLETYNNCPFSYFAKYLLELVPKRSFEISVADSGSFLHDFLDRFSNLIKTERKSDGTPMTWKDADDDFIKLNTPLILKEILTGVNAQMLEIPRIKALFDRLCKTAEQSVYAVRRHIVQSNFIPLGYEISFDEDGTFKPLKIKLDDLSTVTIRGRIDRADEYTVNKDGIDGRFARIIDYKSGRKEISLADVYSGIQLQLFVYLSNLCENGYQPAGILYCNLSDPFVEVSPDATEDEIMNLRTKERRMSGIVLSEHNMFDCMGGEETIKAPKTATARNFNSMFRHLSKLIKKTAEDIYAGKYPIKCVSGACEWCDYKHLCRFDSAFDGCTTTSAADLKDAEIWALLEEDENGMD